MIKDNIYNVVKYLKMIKEIKTMNFESIFSNYQKCNVYKIKSSVNEYLNYIAEEPFYVSPSFCDIKTDERISTLNPKFVLFSAPGAAGKSTLAKYISHSFGSLYWDLSKMKIGENSFSGSILNAVGADKYSDFIKDLNLGRAMLVIDAFDEAEIISGRKMISGFISDINNIVENHSNPQIILLARTETAQYIASFCVENGISLRHYEIGFFTEGKAKEFITKKIAAKKTITPAIEDCINSYYNLIKKNISEEEANSFLGYAPVLEAISTHITSSSNAGQLLQSIENQTDCASIIIKIMDELLIREQGKVVAAFTEKCIDEHPEFTEWGIVYSREEQLIRIINYILFNDEKYSNYIIPDLPVQLVDDYQSILQSFLSQHPFIQNSAQNTLGFNFTGPAFRDFALSTLILDEIGEPCVQLFLDEGSEEVYFPSQIFFDCYTQLNDGVIRSNHISYVYESFRAKAKATQRAYLHMSESEDDKGIAVFGMQDVKRASSEEKETVLGVLFDENDIMFEQFFNTSLDVVNRNVVVGNSKNECSIRNSSIISKQIKWGADKVILESFEPEGIILFSEEKTTGTTPKFEVNHKYNLRVSIPNIYDYFRLIPFKYEMGSMADIDITKFTYALRSILIEFRTHKKDTLAKAIDRIDMAVVGKNVFKQSVLDFLKKKKVIYEAEHLYKIDTTQMQCLGINFMALCRMDICQMNLVFDEYKKFTNT